MSTADADDSARVAPDALEHGAQAAPSVPSASLFRGSRELIIVHCGQEYRLRITKTEKLILTK